MSMTENMTQLGSMMAGVMFVWAVFQRWMPHEFLDAKRFVHKLIYYVYPYVEITFHEYQAEGWFERSKAFVSIERYLSSNASGKAKRLKANVVKDCESVVLSMDDYEEVVDEFNGIKIWWTSDKKTPKQQALFSYRGDQEKRFYRLTCKRRNRDIVVNDYLKHVLDEGKSIAVKSRQRKLYTNNKSENWHGYKQTIWSHVVFKHPSTFDTLAMDPKKKMIS